MNTSLAQRQQELTEQIASEEQALADLQSNLQRVDTELTGLEPQRQQFHLLGVVCESLDQLKEMGCASLFWGDGASAEHEEKTARSRRLAEEFNGQLGALDSKRLALLDGIRNRQDWVEELNFHQDEVTEELENSRYDFVIEREADDEKLFRAGIMPWSRPEDDSRRLRKAVLVSLLFMLVIGGVPRIWEVPPRDPDEKVEIPERLARMVKERVPPKPVQKPVEKQEEKKKDESKPDEPKVANKPKPKEVKKARATASRKGVLAYSSMFEELKEDSVLSNLGSDAKVSGDLTSGGAANNGAAGSRDLIAATTGGSGASAVAGSVSRGGVGNGGGQAITGSGVSTAAVKSEVATRVKETARPLSDGAGPSRTDEEIQIVFDRYKSLLYRIYNRELRNNPSLRGQMVLALTIEPDGRVSLCRVKSSDLDSPTLASKVVSRVKLFNFGAKEGVPTTRITYPIDFLPAR